MRTYTAVAAGILAGAVALAGCASSGGSGNASGNGAGGGAAASGGSGSLVAKHDKEVVYISIGMSNSYDVNYEKALKAVLGKYGYTLTTLDANFDQSKSDQVIQQYLATGKKPAGFIWQPVDPTAGLNSSRLLARRAPVLQVTQLPLSDAAFGYAGPNQEEVGEQMGKLALEARTKATSMGVKLHAQGGNVLYIDGTPGSPADADRYNGFMKATKSAPFTLIRRVDGGFDSDAGYKVANTTIPQFKARGIDFIVAFNLGVASGVARAAQQSGLALGTSTFLISGDCGTGLMSQVASGQVYGTVVQSPYIDGRVAARMLVQYLASGKTASGTQAVPVSATEPPLTATAPSKVTFMSVPAASASNLGTKYWGVTFTQACSGT